MYGRFYDGNWQHHQLNFKPILIYPEVLELIQHKETNRKVIHCLRWA